MSTSYQDNQINEDKALLQPFLVVRLSRQISRLWMDGWMDGGYREREVETVCDVSLKWCGSIALQASPIVADLLGGVGLSALRPRGACCLIAGKGGCWGRTGRGRELWPAWWT